MLSENDFNWCFEQWKSRMEKCRGRGGEYIEGYKMIIEEEKIKRVNRKKICF